jgi:hypothetical protein
MSDQIKDSALVLQIMELIEKGIITQPDEIDAFKLELKTAWGVQKLDEYAKRML